MQHLHLDEFAKKDSYLHRIDPRAKIIGTVLFVFLAAGVNSPSLLFISATVWLGMLLWARIPLSYIISRISWVLPFAGIMIVIFPFVKPGSPLITLDLGFAVLQPTREGAWQALILSGRVAASVMAILFLTLTTRFNYLLRGMALLKVPVVMLQLLEFTVRYIFVAIDELKRMRRARKARAFMAKRSFLHGQTLKTLGQMVGSLFIRSYERGERVYLAMLSRGYTGRMRTINELTLLPKDLVWTVAVVMLGLVIILLDRKGI